MKILLATDGSEYSERAARFLTCLNLSADDEITIFHAVYWIPFLYDKESYYDTLMEIKKDIAPKIIDSSLDILKPVRARISTALLEGSPEEGIVEAAGSSGADMIVMGARGIRGVKSFFVGSVTRSVAVASSRPVLVVKRRACEQPDSIKILFATDGSGHAVATGEFLCRIPFRDDTRVVIVNVMPAEFLDIPETFAPGVSERLAGITDTLKSRRLVESERLTHQARERMSRRFRNIAALSETGDPSTEILKVAETQKADIIAVGCRGLKGIKGMMGSVSRNILAHSESSVLKGPS